MSKSTVIFSINLLVLFGSILVLSATPFWQNAVAIYTPVFALVLFNAIKSIFCFKKGNKPLARTYLLACLLVAVIGGSSCVSIRINKKKKEPAVEKKRPVVFYNPEQKYFC
jgi:hypothetical protein